MSKISLPQTCGITILCTILQSISVLAKPVQNRVGDVEPAQIKVVESTLQLAQVPASNTTPENRVTSVSQLADVQPTDWAFQALQSLVERYGVIAGYPDGTFRGNRAITRYEFAAGLNAALDRVNELIATGVENSVSREDLETLERLEKEFSAELATLRGRVDGLEARNAELEANQFSTTTKLTGQVIFAANTGSFSGDRIINPAGVELANDNPNATVLYRSIIDFNTSFSGTDLLKIRLDTGSNGIRDNATGVLEPNFGSVLDFSARPPRNGEIGLGRAYYSFKPTNDFQVILGAVLVPTDYIDRNSYANASFQDFSTQALVSNYILLPIIGQSSGAIVDWNPSGGAFKLRAMYLAAAANSPDDQGNPTGISLLNRVLYPNATNGDRGLFGDPYQGVVELEYSPSRAFALRLQYSGGKIFDGRFDVFGANAELAISRQVGIFGRYGYGSYNDTAFGDLNPHYWMAGVSVRDLFFPGAIAGIAASQPFIESDVGNGTQTNFEAFYNFPFNDNVRITPLVQVITNPANQDSNGTIVTGTLRTVFTF